MENLQRTLGTRIRELRLKKGFSQESFADHCGLHRTYMGGIERGERNLTLQTMHTVAKGLGISMSELLQDIEDQIPTDAPITWKTRFPGRNRQNN